MEKYNQVAIVYSNGKTKSEKNSFPLTEDVRSDFHGHHLTLYCSAAMIPSEYFRKIYFSYFMCMCVLLVCAWYPWSSEESVKSPGTWSMVGSELSCGFEELNPGSLHEYS